MRARNGRYTTAAQAQRIIERGHGLSEAEIEHFYKRIEAIRQRQGKHTGGEVDEFRNLLERHYGPK